MIGVKPLFSGRSLGEGENASFDVALVAPDGKTLAAQGLRYELLKIESRYQYYRRDGRWEYEPIKSHAPHRRRPDRCRARQARPHLGAGAVGPLSPRSLERRRRRADHLDRLRRRLVHRGQRRHARHAGDRARQAGVQAGRHDDGRRDGAHRRPRHAQRHGRQAARARSPRTCSPAPRSIRMPVGSRLGHRRLCGGDPAPSARRAGAAHAGPRHRRAVVLDRPQGAARWRST